MRLEPTSTGCVRIPETKAEIEMLDREYRRENKKLLNRCYRKNICTRCLGSKTEYDYNYDNCDYEHLIPCKKCKGTGKHRIEVDKKN